MKSQKDTKRKKHLQTKLKTQAAMSAQNDNLSKIPLFYTWVSVTAVNKLEPWKQ